MADIEILSTVAPLEDLPGEGLPRVVAVLNRPDAVQRVEPQARSWNVWLPGMDTFRTLAA